MKQALCILALLLLGAAPSLAADAEGIYRSSCAGCHGVDGTKASGGSTPLKNQSAEDIAAKLEGYAGGGFGGKQKHVMENIVKKHSPEELKEIAAYAAGL